MLRFEYHNSLLENRKLNMFGYNTKWHFYIQIMYKSIWKYNRNRTITFLILDIYNQIKTHYWRYPTTIVSYFIIGVLHEHMTLIWCLSPLIGFFLTPIMGSLSDRCKSNLGRRRPFIILLSIGVIFGKYLLLLLYDTKCCQQNNI